MNRSVPDSSINEEMLADKRSYDPRFDSTSDDQKPTKNKAKPATESGSDPGQERVLGGSGRPKEQKLELKKQDLEKCGNLLSTSEAAAAIGLSKSEFKRRELTGVYAATYVDRNGYHFYSTEYLSKLPGYGTEPKKIVGRIRGKIKGIQIAQALKSETRRQEMAFASPVSTESEIAAKIFQALDSGMSSRDIVINMHIHPTLVSKTYAAWLEMGNMEGGGFQVSAKTLEAINSLPLGFGSYPVQNEQQLLANLQEACAAASMCTLCKQHPRKYCTPCTEKMAAEVTAESAPAAKRQIGRPRKSA